LRFDERYDAGLLRRGRESGEQLLTERAHVERRKEYFLVTLIYNHACRFL
jgi:hypothetical protein